MFAIVYCAIAPLQTNAQETNNQSFSLDFQQPFPVPGTVDEYAEEGAPFVRYFPSTEYGEHYQNWWVTQDNRGVMYFANNNGVLEYSGNVWRLIPVSTIVKSLDVNKKGVVYVGAQGDFGYLAPDTVGQMQFISLVPDELAKEGFADVWNTFCINDEVYFLTLSTIFRYKDGKVETFADDVNLRAHLGFKVRNELYLIQRGKGITKVVDDAIVPIKSGDFFDKMGVFAMLPYDKDKILIGSSRDGLYLYDGADVMPFKSEVNDICKREKLYHGVELPDDRFAFALANRGGTIIINKFGILETVINKSTGVRKENATCLFVDKNEHLWLSLLNGIAVADINSPFTHFNENNGVESTILSLERYKDDLYAGTRLGLFKLQKTDDPTRVASFEKQNELYTWALHAMSDRFIMGGIGVHEMKDTSEYRLITPGRLFVLEGSLLDTNMVYGGFMQGIKVMKLNPETDTWTSSGFVTSVKEEIRSIYETNDGKLWLGTDYQGVICVDFVSAPGDTIVRKYAEEQGLPSEQVYVTSIRGKPYFTTKEGLYRHDEETDKFVPAPEALGEFFADSENLLYSLFEQSNGNIYTILNDEAGVARRQADGRYIWDSRPFKQLRGFSPTKIIPGVNNVVWLVVNDGLIRYDSKQEFQVNPLFSTSITSIYINRDSLLFGGTFVDEDGRIVSHQSGWHQVELEPDDNDITFNFSALSYDMFPHNEFTYKLDGFDKAWSKWQSLASKEYTNLPHGDYTFRVRSRNVHDMEGGETAFRFKIKPPWTRTTLAYVLYLIIFAFFIYIVAVLYSRSLRRKNRILAENVEERTKELKAKSESLEAQKLETEQQKLIVEEKNKNITDSIKYAQRIQEAILPLEEDIHRVFPEHFIFYKPRDIVSGDFYWFSLVYGRAVLAVGDCTGHGVPGAFMSMIGNDLLHQIVNDNKVTSPSIALSILDKKVQYALNHGEHSDHQDGMDIALCSFDLEQNTVEFAGAYRPFILVREGVVVEFKGTKRSIGASFSQEKPFTEETINLEEGDYIYLFSDGYVDQYGGPENKKFMMRRFQDMLLSLGGKSMDEQKEIVEHTFTQWMGEQEQLDDILLMGIQI